MRMPEASMIIEMRTYKTKPGKRARFLEIFRSKSIPAHIEIGMKILGPFLSVEDSDIFFWMRGFPDLVSREPMKAKFYEGELWKSELEQILMPMPEKYDVVLVDDAEGLLHWHARRQRRQNQARASGRIRLKQSRRNRRLPICRNHPQLVRLARGQGIEIVRLQN